MTSSGWRTATAAHERAPVEAYLGLGANLGDRERHLRSALAHLAAHVTIAAVSSVWETEPVGYAEQDAFWNLVACIRTGLPPAALLATLKRVEREVGRTPRFRNGPREIDVDLLLYDDVVLRTAALEIPHPRMTGRAFVLRPLAELAPDRVLPHTGRTVRDHVDHGGPFERAIALFPGDTFLEP